jgi:penicillin-binding protein 1A
VDEDSERYFPNHKLKPDIGLAEYEFACARVGKTDESITWATNISVAIATAATFAAFRLNDYAQEIANAGTEESTLRLIAHCAILAFSLLSIVHLSYLHKARVFASRKIIVLRRMLGVSYGESSLVLPNWRIEGADNPFAIRLAPTFLSYQTYPVHMVLVASFVSTLLLGSELCSKINSSLVHSFLPHVSPGYLGIFFYFIGLFVFRWQLRESDENLWLWLSRIVAYILRVPVTAGINTKVYGIKLAIAESERLRTDLKNLREIAVFLEDGEFWSHSGINWKGVARAVESRLQRKFSGGGSSITQQLARSNFITRLSPTIRRKLVETFLAKWVNSVWSKGVQLDAYLVTARFDNGVYGVQAAYRHFFGEAPKHIERWEAFVLVERLGNVRSKFIGLRVREQLRRCIVAKVLTEDDARLALGYYEGMMNIHFVQAEDQPNPEQVRIDLLL